MKPEELEAAKLALDERRLSLDEREKEARLQIDLNKERREGRFFRANLGVMIAASISFATVFVSTIQFLIAQRQEQNKQLAETQSRIDEHKLKVLEFLTKNRIEIFSDEKKVQAQIRTIMEAGFPPEITIPIFNQLKVSAPQGDQTWNVGSINYQWLRVGEGDCAGRDVGSSDGPSPSLAKCDMGFVGRVAVCWDGSSHINGGTRKWCTYKSSTPDSCSGGNARGVMYQCGTHISSN